jgi:hypothetical protein
MKEIKKLELVSQPFSLLRSWRQWVGRVESLYASRVRRQVYLWRAQGSRPEFLPRLPWWHPFVYRFLRLVGRLPQRQWVRRGEPRPVPVARRGARVYILRP